ncbi:MAG: hypothetical protein HQL91_00095 [Magnetococcales bacterium]|nr:hypothetical protein [Magnetococcales bacterium]
MIDLTIPPPAPVHHYWPWIVSILLIGITAWGLYTFFVVPILRKRRIHASIPYCPSLLLPPRTHQYDKNLSIASHRLIHFSYRVNLFHLTCTCLRFRRHRGLYPPNDIRRLCRHLRRELQPTAYNQQLDELTRGLLATRLTDACYSREQLSRSEIIVGFHPRSSIVRVYTFRKSPVDPPGGPFTGPVHKFTYNYHQDIWIYGEPPPNSEEVLAAISNLMTANRARYPQQDKLPLLRVENLPTPIPANEAAQTVRTRRERILSANPSTTPLEKP